MDSTTDQLPMTDQPVYPLHVGFPPNTNQSYMLPNPRASNVNVSPPAQGGPPPTTWWPMPGPEIIPHLPGYPPNANQSYNSPNPGAPSVNVPPPGPPLTMLPTPAQQDNMRPLMREEPFVQFPAYNAPLTRQPPANPTMMRPESAYIRQPGHSQVQNGSDSLRQQDPFRYNEYGMTPPPRQVGHGPQQAYRNRLYQGEHRSGIDGDEVMQTRFLDELHMIRMGSSQAFSYDVADWMFRVAIFHCVQSSNGNR